MSTLYRYLTKERADKLVTNGEDWIGTLHGFRDIEKHGDHRGDKEEGVKSGTLSENGTYTPQTLPPMLSRFIKGSGAIKMKLAAITRKDTTRNCYIYCMSKLEKDERLFKDFGEVCVSIFNLEAFLTAVTEKIAKAMPVEYRGFHECIYQPRHTNHNDWTSIDPSIIKSPDYVYQHEVRALWFPIDRKATLSPIPISSAKLIQHCKII